jgi:hypothetical protein
MGTIRGSRSCEGAARVALTAGRGVAAAAQCSCMEGGGCQNTRWWQS